MRKLKYLLLGIGIFVGWFFTSNAQEAITSGVDDDILINREYIKKRVERGIKQHLSRKDRLELMGKRWDRHHQDSDVYTLARFPYYSSYFEDNDFVSVFLSGAWTNEAYSSHGHSQDLAKLIFGQGTITTKEIVCASKLLTQKNLTGIAPLGDVENAIKYHYLSIFSTQQFNLHASMEEYAFDVNYARHFLKGELTIGFYVPLKLREQHLRLTNSYDPALWAQMVSAERWLDTQTPKPTELYFTKNYGDNIEDFFSDILDRKNIAFNKKQTTSGFGDVALYANFDIPSRYIDRFVLGLMVQIPTAPERDTEKLWYADLGNGGFAEISGFASCLWLSSLKWFNPYIHAKATYSCIGHVDRRVPKQNNYDAINKMFNGQKVAMDQLTKSYLIFGETLKFRNDVSFSEVDTTFRNFSDTAINIAIQPGPSLFLRLGNTFEYIFSSKGFFDIYYDLFLKGKDYLHKHNNDDYYKPSVLLDNTYVVTHTLAAAYSYAFDKCFRLGLDGNWIFAGRNAPETFGLKLFFNAEF